jgi:GAF domain-containing protein
LREFQAKSRNGQKSSLAIGLRGSKPSFDFSLSSAQANPAYLGADRSERGMGIDPQFLYWLSEIVLAGLNLHDLIQRMLRLTLQAVNATSGSIILLDKSGDIKVAYMAYQDDVRFAGSENLADVLQQGLAGWVLKNRQFALVMSTSYDPRWLQRPWEGNGTRPRSALAVPLVADGEIVGVLSLARPQTQQFTQQDLTKLQDIMVAAHTW